MACSKYTLTNTGTSIANFSYRRCDDNMWEYQVPLDPSETKNIWLINGSYGTAFSNVILLVNQGAFPPLNATATPTPTPTLTPTNTPTPSVTATQTPTQTNTPSQTQTQTQTNTQTNTQTTTVTSTPTPTGTAAVTPTPTNTNTPSQTPTDTPSSTSTPTPTRSKVAFTVYSGTTHDEACGRYNPTVTVYGNNSQFDLSTQFSNISTGDATINMTGFIQNGGYVSQLDTNGNVVGSVTICVTLTPTPTMTPTMTKTPTNTPSPTPTFGYYTYILGTGSTANLACIDFSGAPNTIYGTVAGGIGPNIAEFLYYNSSLTTPVMNGFYSNGTAVFEVTGGSGQITAVDPSGC